MRLKNNQELANRILQAYGLNPEKLLPEAKGYRNLILPAVLHDGRTMTAIIFKSEPDILTTIGCADNIAEHLAARGFAVRQRLDQKTLVLNQGSQNPKYAAVYSYLPGKTIPWEAYTRGHIKALGKAMSDMHAALRSFDASSLPSTETIYLKILKRMRSYFANKGVQKAMAAKLHLQLGPGRFETYQTLLEQCQRLNGRQALHMDFVRGNVLFAGEQSPDGLARITGILDFEKTSAGHPLLDIARTLAFLLVDCKFKTPDQVRKYFLYSGYAKRGKAKLPTANVRLYNSKTTLLEMLTDLFLLHDFYKFLRHNPYESLERNEHYLRTRNLLLERQLVQTTTPQP